MDVKCERDFNGLGTKVSDLDTRFQVCQVGKEKDIKTLGDRMGKAENHLDDLYNAHQDSLKMQYKIVGGLTVILVIIEIVMPFIMKKVGG